MHHSLGQNLNFPLFSRIPVYWNIPVTWKLFRETSLHYATTGLLQDYCHSNYEVSMNRRTVGTRLTRRHIGLEVLTEVVMRSSVNQRFGGTCRLHLQVRRLRQARNKHEAVGSCKRRLTFNGLHDVISMKTELFTKVTFQKEYFSYSLL
jgi:hypothetical protein